MKSRKKYKQAHTDNTKFGMGDFYGTGIRNPSGKVRQMFMVDQKPAGKKSLKKPPRTLA